MALRAGYYGIKRKLKAKLADIAGAWDQYVNKIDDELPSAINANTALFTETIGYNTKNKAAHVHEGINRTVVFSYKPGGILNVNGTNSSATEVARENSDTYTLAKGRYKVSCKNANSDVYMIVYSSTTSSRIITVEDSDVHIFTLASDTVVSIIVDVKGGKTADDLDLYPMIYDADILDDTFEEYNTEIVSSVLSDHKTTINAIITAATGAADFAAFKAAMGAITPVTRSLNRETSPEDVSEEVIEEEKPVTKKTSKKTVKEGE